MWEIVIGKCFLLFVKVNWLLFLMISTESLAICNKVEVFDFICLTSICKRISLWNYTKYYCKKVWIITFIWFIFGFYNYWKGTYYTITFVFLENVKSWFAMLIVWICNMENLQFSIQGQLEVGIKKTRFHNILYYLLI